MNAETLLTLNVAILFGIICAYVAKRRNRNPSAWFALGFFLTFIGLFLVFVLPPLAQPKLYRAPVNADAVSAAALAPRAKILRVALIVLVSTLTVSFALLLRELIGEHYPNLF